MGNIAFVLINGLMAWSWYYGNYDYLNVVTAFYIVIIILVVPVAPMLWWMSHNSHAITSNKGKATLEEWVRPSVIIRVFNWVKLAITVTLMFACGYLWLVVFYVLACLWNNLMRIMANKDI